MGHFPFAGLTAKGKPSRLWLVLIITQLLQFLLNDMSSFKIQPPFALS
jgi:hypothetical protein